MCMLVHHPETAEPFERDNFIDINRRNPHGFGLIWRSPSGEVRSKRGLLDLNEQWTMYRTLYANGCREMVLHWRYRTAGPVNEANCHPIVVPKTPVLMMHNGACIGPSTHNKSDSVVFAERILSPLFEGSTEDLDHPTTVAWLEQRIGNGNRLILWDRERPIPTIVGEKTGLWWKGRWYSNTYAWTVPAEAQVVRPRFNWHNYA